MQTNWAFFGTYWPFLVPLIILEFGLMITAVVHVLQHPHYRIGNRALWLVIVIFIQIIGPIAYFVFGREDQS
ncbi:PLDc N-terminal domain-containing protein [Lacticaseibacillus rhamnosus]|uniref:PLDc N-terminal domain-containing protein n=1 Tax=Lacticaseibacillus rhamnosus TaxID=47715 RepID=UPI00065AC480|nr:PLD nuclease N-terminal domain-containing protein [Lacticaseibacillus rhamnosus]KMO45666.1 membrane protein [Lacticaseibacillus rhamnosus]OAT97268.1 membrane protein [Lacticaseibacillus rhamnosus]